MSEVEKFLLGVGEFLSEFGNVLPRPFETKYSWVRRMRGQEGSRLYHAAYNAKRQKLISVHEKNGQKFIELTSKGELKILFTKAHMCYSRAWDGMWRLIMFDIPESSRDKRKQLRYLLECNGFIKLQASVFISPQSLHEDAVKYLKESGLIGFIRFARIDVLDDDLPLRKKFSLT